MIIFEEVENCNVGQELMLPKSYLSIRERLQLLFTGRVPKVTHKLVVMLSGGGMVELGLFVGGLKWESGEDSPVMVSTDPGHALQLLKNGAFQLERRNSATNFVPGGSADEH